MKKFRQKGAATIEYSVVTALLVVALFGGGGDVIAEVVDALREAYRSFSFALSVPWL